MGRASPDASPGISHKALHYFRSEYGIVVTASKTTNSYPFAPASLSEVYPEWQEWNIVFEPSIVLRQPKT